MVTREIGCRLSDRKREVNDIDKMADEQKEVTDKWYDQGEIRPTFSNQKMPIHFFK